MYQASISNLLDADADIATVSRLLGHERLETTAIYTQPTAKDLEAAVQRLERDADQDRSEDKGYAK